MAHRLTVVVSQSRSQNPKKRGLEEELVASLLGERGIDLTVVPNLYDLKAHGTGMLCLSGISGDLVVCSWLFPRAARWILDRNKISGQEGATLLKSQGEDDEESESDNDKKNDKDDDKERVIDRRDLPSRKIYCLDLRAYDNTTVFLDEIKRIANELSTPMVELTSWIQGSPKPEQMARYLNGAASNNGNGGNGNGGNGNGGNGDGDNKHSGNGHNSNGKSDVPATIAQLVPTLGPIVIDEDADRRWYPVIDFSRCTSCLECIDFCLFGVYGIDKQETILVEQPDNCRLGCPACSRVCPENAIIFPQHKTPTIAGSPEIGVNQKVDLSILFGAPDPGKQGSDTAAEVAARERDEQLQLAGRETMPSPKPAEQHPTAATPPDDLDRLMDSLDELDL